MSYFPLRIAMLINPTESHHAEMQSREALAAAHTLDSTSVSSTPGRSAMSMGF
jgi:hypothetical protein